MGAEDCDHSFILKDDIGSVCRVCGLIERGIETIIEYQYAKVWFFLALSCASLVFLSFICLVGSNYIPVLVI